MLIDIEEKKKKSKVKLTLFPKNSEVPARFRFLRTEIFFYGALSAGQPKTAAL